MLSVKGTFLQQSKWAVRRLLKERMALLQTSRTPITRKKNTRRVISDLNQKSKADSGTCCKPMPEAPTQLPPGKMEDTCPL